MAAAGNHYVRQVKKLRNRNYSNLSLFSQKRVPDKLSFVCVCQSYNFKEIEKVIKFVNLETPNCIIQLITHDATGFHELYILAV